MLESPCGLCGLPTERVCLALYQGAGTGCDVSRRGVRLCASSKFGSVVSLEEFPDRDLLEEALAA